MRIYEKLWQAFKRQCQGYDDGSEFFLNGDYESLEDPIIEAMAEAFVKSAADVFENIQDAFDEAIEEYISDALNTASDEEEWLKNDEAMEACHAQAKDDVEANMDDIDFVFDFSDNTDYISEAVIDAFQDNIRDSIEDTADDIIDEAIEDNRDEYKDYESETDDEDDDSDSDDEDCDEDADDEDSSGKIYLIEADRCRKGRCLFCTNKCPRHAISFSGGDVIIDQSKCNNCGKCRDKCPCNAIVTVDIDSNESSLYDDLD